MKAQRGKTRKKITQGKNAGLTRRQKVREKLVSAVFYLAACMAGRQGLAPVGHKKKQWTGKKRSRSDKIGALFRSIYPKEEAVFGTPRMFVLPGRSETKQAASMFLISGGDA